MNRIDASLFDYKTEIKCTFPSQKKRSLCAKKCLTFYQICEIFTLASTIHCQLERRINATFTRHWTNFARFRKFVRIGFPFTQDHLNRTKIYTLSRSNGFVICFISQWMKKSKHGFFVFPPKKTLIWRRHVGLANRVAVWRQSEVSVDF